MRTEAEVDTEARLQSPCSATRVPASGVERGSGVGVEVGLCLGLGQRGVTLRHDPVGTVHAAARIHRRATAPARALVGWLAVGVGFGFGFGFAFGFGYFHPPAQRVRNRVIGSDR